MDKRQSSIIKIATEEHEFEQIHQLNYKTFVEEIPQHPPNDQKKLVDKFHDENTYIICKDEDKVIGMVAIRAKRPFSLDEKIENLDSHLPAAKSICEARLLAIDPKYRSPKVFAKLMVETANYCEVKGHDLMIISGTIKQLKLYKRFGFKPFGTIVGSSEAQFQPMYYDLEAAQSFKRTSKMFS
jgi:predicted N-acetyltransferase YhbS